MQASISTRRASTGLSRKNLFFLLILISAFDYRVGKGPTFALVELGCYFFVSILFFDNLIGARQASRKLMASFRAAPYIYLYFLWIFFAALIGVFKSIESVWAFRNLLPSLIVFSLASVYVQSIADIKKVLLLLVLGGGVNIFLAFLQVQFGGPYPNEIHDGALIKMNLEGDFLDNTPTGFFVHPNGLAMFLIPSFLILVNAVFGRPRVPDGKIAFSLVFLIAAAYILWLTFSKGVFLWVGIGSMLLVYGAYAKRSVYIFALASIFVLIPGSVIYSLLLSDQGVKTLDSMGTRLSIWRAALEVLASDPLILFLGNGYQEVFAQTTYSTELPYSNAHNNLLNQVIFFGLPALVLHLLSVFGFLFRLKKNRRTLSKEHKSLNVLLFVIVAMQFGELFFEPALDSVGLQFQFYLMMALGFSSIKVALDGRRKF